MGQAGAAARSVAAWAGAQVDASGWEPRLRGVLTDPERALRDSAWGGPREPFTHCLWWPPGRVAGPSLAPWVAERDRTLRLDFAWHPSGLPVDVPIPVRAPGAEPTHPGAHVDDVTLFAAAEARELLALARTERATWALERRLERRLHEFEEREQKVIRELRAAGFLRRADAP